MTPPTPTSKTNHSRRKGSTGAFFAAALLALTSSYQPANAGQIWTGTGVTSAWSDNGNWGGTAPNYAVGLQFGGILNLAAVNDATATSAGLSFDATAGAFTLSGNAITLGGGPLGGIINNSTNVQTIAFGGTGVTLGASQTWFSGLLPGGGLIVGSAVDLAGQTLTINGSNNTTLSGPISDSGAGAGQINKVGAGTLLLSGTNTFTGPTTVTDGLLQLQNGAAIADTATVSVTAPGALALLSSETIGTLTGSGNTNLNANTLTVGGNGVIAVPGDSVYSGNLTGVGGSLAKNSAGIFTTSGTNTYTGTTTVNAGTLNVLGTHTGGGGYTIAPGATLAGTGAITEAPGASITENGAIVVGDATLAVPVASTLTVVTSGAGAINMGVGSTLVVDLFTGAGLGNNNAVPGSSDTFILGGALNSVAGGTLVIANPNGQTGFTGGDSWQVVTLLPGATITGNLGLTGNLDTTALNLTATQVGNFNQTSGVFTIVDTLTGLQMANAMGQAVLAGAESVLTDVNGRLFFLRAGQGDLADQDEYDQGVVSGQGDKNPAPPPAAQRRPSPGNWEVFATANYNNARLGALGGLQAGVQSDSWTQGIGAEVHLTSSLALGFAANWLESRQTFTGNVGSMDMNGYALSAYTSYVKKAFWANLLYSFGNYDIDTTRNPIGFASAQGDTNAYTNSIQFNSGWNFRFQNNSLVTGPFIGLDYTHVSVDAYSETGGGLAALAYGKRTAESLISRIGWSVSKYVPTDFGVITAQARLSYERQNLSNNNGTTVGLINQPFVVGNGAQSYGRDYMVAGAGLNFQFTPAFGMLLNYQGQFFRQNVQAHYVGLRFSYKF
ncbi:autotransporter domain-containing protein [Prosthecobacter sp.]|uniref:autotransporter family protein n=1 Tax=Prosthecobacter sp. TaxID=1965333 RepID=UPI00378377FC